MRTRLLAVAVLMVAAGLAPARAEAARGFSYGVASAEVTHTTARVWARADRAGRVFLRVTRCRPSRGIRRWVRARRANDLTVQAVVRRLRPGTRYCYRFRMRARRRGGRRGRLIAISDLGTFTTAPDPSSDTAVRFAWSGDMDAQPRPGQTSPHWNDFQILRLMEQEGNDFNVLLGDVIYSDTEVPGVFKAGVPDALTRQQDWGKYRMNLEHPSFQLLRRSGPVYNHWDDHEFINDFQPGANKFTTGPEHGDAGDERRIIEADGREIYRASVGAFRDYMPVTYTSRDGIYRSFRWGRNLEVFLPDERSFRSNAADLGDECDNPNTEGLDGKPEADRAPMTEGLPARTEYGLFVSSVRGPVAQQCKDLINDPNRTLLGARQYQVFTDAIKRSTATWKVVMNELPIQQYYIDPYDRWEGYEAERRRLALFLRDNVKNVVFLTADVHANLVNTIKFDAGRSSEVDTGILEVTTGPIATKNFSEEINDDVGNDAVGPAVYASVLKPPPPQGLALQCAALAVFSYGQVEVTDKTLRIELKDIDGDTVREQGGLTCGPYTLTAR